VADRKPAKAAESPYAAQLMNLQKGTLSSGTYVGNAVGQSFTYTANSLNLGGSTT